MRKFISGLILVCVLSFPAATVRANSMGAGCCHDHPNSFCCQLYMYGLQQGWW